MGHANVAVRAVASGAFSPVLALALGCGSSGEQLTPDAGFSGAGAIYVLRSVGGAALPAVWISNESVTITVLADTITLREGGRGRRVLVERYREQTPPASPARREEGGFDYARRGDRIEIMLPCPDLALCIAPPHFVGTVTANGLVFDHALNYTTPLRYERVNR